MEESSAARGDLDWRAGGRECHVPIAPLDWTKGGSPSDLSTSSSKDFEKVEQAMNAV